MGVTWALGWALVGVLLAAASTVLPPSIWNAFAKVFDAPAPALAVPGFVGGVLFSVVLGIAGRKNRIEDLSIGRVAAWGAIGGVLVSLVPAAMVLVGLATLNAQGGALWQLTATIAVPLALLSAVSAAVTLKLAQRSSRDTPVEVAS
jgi:hypothetical protein